MPALSRAILVIALLAFAPIAAAQPVLPGPGPGPGPTPPSPAPGPASQGGLITKITPQQLAQLYSGQTINGQPIQVSVKTLNNGTTVVILPLWGNQVASAIIPALCEKDGSGCPLLHFFVTMGKQGSVDANWINGFNRDYPLIKAILLTDGELVFTVDIALYGGVSPNEILAYTQIFKLLVDKSFSYKPQQ